MMSGIQGKNTGPEKKIRSALHRLGYRYKIHDPALPGKPDLVFPKYRAVIRINGCFWHLHDCHLFKWPASRTEFWCNKITGNRDRDRHQFEELSKKGWRVLTIWECALKGKYRLEFSDLIKSTTKWLESETLTLEIAGNPDIHLKQK